MADMKTRIENLATRMATEAKALRTLINGNAGNLNALQTAVKDNLINAINELQAEIIALGNPATINDASGASLVQTYSVTKILQLIIDAKAEILGGAGAAYDTLQELKAYVDGGAAADVVALGNRLRIDVNNQGLTAPQKQNGQDNLDVYSRAQIGNPDTDFIAIFNAGLL
jgi:hypothetical protein